MVNLNDMIDDETYTSLLIDNDFEDLGLFDLTFVNDDNSMTLSESIDILCDYEMENS